MPRIFLGLAALLTLAATAWTAEQGIVSGPRSAVRGEYRAKGYFIRSAPEVPGETVPGDEAPVQALEIVRPLMSRVTIGRLYTSCACLRLEAPKAEFALDEPAILTLRNIAPTPPAGRTYAVYVQLVSPVRVTLRYDAFVRSEKFVDREPVAAPRGREESAHESDAPAPLPAAEPARGFAEPAESGEQGHFAEEEWFPPPGR